MNPTETQTTPPKVETAPIKAETKLTTQELQEKTTQEILEKYWVDLKNYTCDRSKCDWNALLKEVKTTPSQKAIEETTKKVYEKYLTEKLQTLEWLKEVASLKNLTDSIESERLQNMKNEFEKVLNPALDKYDFLDPQTKEFIKIGIANSMMKWPTWEIMDSLVWSFWSFMADLSKMDAKWLNELLSNKSNEPKDSWRTLSLEEKFSEDLKKYLNKFGEINKKFDENNIADEKQKENIISNIDWFRNPALIEAGAEWLDVNNIDFKKITKNDKPLDTKAISEYLMNSRENLVDLSRKMTMWDKWADLAYELIWNWWPIWEWAEKLLEIILKLPIIWKIFAMFLWLDPNNALNELKENSSNFKYLSSLKSLWVSKDKEWKTIEWKDPFQKIDLSDIRFNIVKNEMKEVKAIFGETKEEDLSAKWEKAFSKDWIDTPDWTFKVEFKEENLKDKNSKKLTSLELKEILRNGLTNLENERQEEKNIKEAEEKQKEIERFKKEEGALNIFSWKWLSDIAQFWDFHDFKNIKLVDIKDQTDEKELWFILKRAIWEWWAFVASDYENLDDNTKEALLKVISLIQEFLKENTDFDIKNKDIWDILKDEKFSKFLQEKQNKQDEFKKQMWMADKIRSASDISLVKNWLDIWEWKIIKFDTEKQQLSIWEDNYKITLNSDWKDYKLQDIKIEESRVEFKPDIPDWKLTAWRLENPNLWYVWKNTVIKWIMELTQKWNYEYNNGTRLTFVKV